MLGTLLFEKKQWFLKVSRVITLFILTKHFNFITTLPTYWYPAYRVVFLCFIGSKGRNNESNQKAAFEKRTRKPKYIDTERIKRNMRIHMLIFLGVLRKYLYTYM